MPLSKDASTVKMDTVSLALTIPDVLVGCVAVSRYVFAFACTEKLNCSQEQTRRQFHSTSLQNEDAEDELALNIPDVRGDVYDSGQVLAFACTDN